MKEQILLGEKGSYFLDMLSVRACGSFGWRSPYVRHLHVWLGFQRCEPWKDLFRSHSVEKVTDVKRVQDRVRMKLAKCGHLRKERPKEVKKRTQRGKRKHADNG